MKTINLYTCERDEQGKITFELFVPIKVETSFPDDIIQLKDVIAISTVKTIAPRCKRLESPDAEPCSGTCACNVLHWKASYHLSVTTDKGQKLIATDVVYFALVKSIFKAKIVDHVSDDRETIKIEKWFFNSDPNVV